MEEWHQSVITDDSSVVTSNLDEIGQPCNEKYVLHSSDPDESIRANSIITVALCMFPLAPGNWL